MIGLAVLATGLAAGLAVALAAGGPDLVPDWSARPRLMARGTRSGRAGGDVGPGRLWAGSAVLGLVALALLWGLTGIPAACVVPAAAVGALPHLVLARRRTRRLRRIQEAWPDGLRELRAAITAGLSLHGALVALVRDGPPVLREALLDLPALAEVTGVVPALETVREELADATTDRVVEVLILAHERGGPLLPQVLADLAEATARDLRTREGIETAALEQRLNAGAVFALPWLVLLLLILRPGVFRTFYAGPGGLPVVALGAVLSSVGLWAVLRLSRQPVEERVLGTGESPGGRR